VFPHFYIGHPTRRRWPILCAWGWLVTNPEHELFLRQHQTQGTGSRVLSERAHDLSYRGIIPRELARTIQTNSDLEEDGLEDTDNFSLEDQPDQVALEVEKSRSRHKSLEQILRVPHLLLLGLRKIRHEYMCRIHLWTDLHPRTLTPAPLPVLSPPPLIQTSSSRSATSLPRRIHAWLSHPVGRDWLRGLRALLPSSQIAYERTIREFNVGRTSPASLARLLQNLGVPIRHHSEVMVGPSLRSWRSIREQWSNTCSCMNRHSSPGFCRTCGLASPLAAVPTSQVCYLCNRRSANMSC
jgi:hypothetical protein